MTDVKSQTYTLIGLIYNQLHYKQAGPAEIIVPAKHFHNLHDLPQTVASSSICTISATPPSIHQLQTSRTSFHFPSEDMPALGTSKDAKIPAELGQGSAHTRQPTKAHVQARPSIPCIGTISIVRRISHHMAPPGALHAFGACIARVFSLHLGQLVHTHSLQGYPSPSQALSQSGTTWIHRICACLRSLAF